MSLFDDASLVYIPTGYKPTKNYSGKPSTGGADMTFSRASGATRVNSKGLVEKVRTNLILQSNTFSSASWGKPNTTLTGGQPDKDGGSNAWKFEATTAGTPQLTQATGTSGIISISFYAKAGNLSIIKLWVGTGIDFDLSAGTAIGSSNASIENVGNGWFRCKYFGIYSTINPYITAASAGDYVYIQDAQVEYGTVATNYIETTSAAVSVGPVNDEPRLTYDPVNPTAPSLLMEPQRTNLFEYSEYMNGLNLIQATVTENAETSPEGLVNAARLYDNTTYAQHRVGDNAISVTSGTTYTLSVFAKKGTLRYCYLLSSASASTERYFFDLQEGTAITSGGTIEDYGNGWYRLSAQSTASATGNAAFAFNLTNEDQDNTYVGTGTDYHIVYGLQLEAGSYPTSYIPTNGTSVTRVADASFKTGISDLIGQTEGTLFFEIQDTEHFVSYFGVDNVSTGTRILVYGLDDQKVYAQVRNGGTIVFSASSAVISGRAKAAVSFNAGGSVFYVNGTQVGSGSGTTYTNLSKFTLNHSSQVGSSLNKALLFPTRLDNATLATLTSL